MKTKIITLTQAEWSTYDKAYGNKVIFDGDKQFRWGAMAVFE